MSRRTEAPASRPFMDVERFQTVFSPSDVRVLLRHGPFIKEVRMPGTFSVYKRGAEMIVGSPVTDETVNIQFPELAHVRVMSGAAEPLVPSVQDLRALSTAAYGVFVRRNPDTFDKEFRVMAGKKLTDEQLEQVRRMHLDVYSTSEYEALLKEFGFHSADVTREKGDDLDSLPSVTVFNQL